MKYNCGVYVIENGINGHYYIGSSADLDARFKQHINQLRQGGHHNQHLQNAYNKFGEVQFFFRVILFCEPEERKRYEEDLIKTWQPDYNIGWNGQGVWEKNERLRKLIEEQNEILRPRNKNYGRLLRAVTAPRIHTIAEFDKDTGKQKKSRPGLSYTDLDKLAKELKDYHNDHHSWRETATKFNILTAKGLLDPSMAERMANGYEPKTLEARKRFNLSPKCPTCQHIEKRPVVTATQQEKLMNATAQKEKIKDDDLYYATCAQVGCKVTLYFIETPNPLSEERLLHDRHTQKAYINVEP